MDWAQQSHHLNQILQTLPLRHQCEGRQQAKQRQKLKAKGKGRATVYKEGAKGKGIFQEAAAHEHKKPSKKTKKEEESEKKEDWAQGA